MFGKNRGICWGNILSFQQAWFPAVPKHGRAVFTLVGDGVRSFDCKDPPPGSLTPIWKVELLCALLVALASAVQCILCAV